MRSSPLQEASLKKSLTSSDLSDSQLSQLAFSSTFPSTQPNLPSQNNLDLSQYDPDEFIIAENRAIKREWQIIENYLDQLTKNENKKDEEDEENEDDFCLIEEPENKSPLSKRDEDDFFSIESKRPATHKQYQFKKVNEEITPSFNDVTPVKKTKEDAYSLYFFKRNRQIVSNETQQSSSENERLINERLIYELEAAACALYKFIAPYHIPKARVYYGDKEEEHGVASKGIPRFKSVQKDPLKEEDLNIEALKYYTIEELDALDIKFRKENRCFHENEIIDYKKIGEDDFFSLTAKEFDKYRMIKGLAIGHTVSYVNAEDDCHQGNISKYGQRVDFDTTFTKVLYPHKKTRLFARLFDDLFREPTGRFNMSENDIRKLPILTDAKPFYSSTTPPPIISENAYKLLSSIFPVSQNAFSKEDNDLYAKLADHPVFIYHKFATLLKFILTTKEMYYEIVKLHLNEESTYQNERVIDLLVNYAYERVEQLKNILMNMVEFQEFMAKHGDHVIENIKNEWKEDNEYYQKKMKEKNKPFYKNILVDLDKVDTSFHEIKNKMLQTDRGLSFSVFGYR